MHLFIQMCVLSSKIERYHLEFDSNWAISSNYFIQYIAKFSLKFFFYRFCAKNRSKKKRWCWAGPLKRNQRQQWFQKFGRTIRTKTTCVSRVEEMYMWHWRSEHNYLEKESNLSSIVICYSVLHCSQKAALALVLKCYVPRCQFSLWF
jgi:hypothetical protein